jgi:hypothetical protein
MRFWQSLQVACIATSLIACVLLMVMCVRSYWYMDVLFGPLSATRPFQLSSEIGRLQLVVSNVSPGRAGNWGKFSYRNGTSMPAPPPKSGIVASSSNLSAGFPYWFLAMVAILPAFLLRKQEYRFGLRALLVATTVVAVILGLVVYVIR